GLRPGARSAELHSAVSQICNLRGVENLKVAGNENALPNSIRRYGRVQLCATCGRPPALRFQKRTDPSFRQGRLGSISSTNLRPRQSRLWGRRDALPYVYGKGGPTITR